MTPHDEAVVSQKALASELRALYEARQFQRVVERFESAGQGIVRTFFGDAAVLQIAAQAYLRISDFSTSAETFLSAAAIHASNQSPETSACVRNAFAALQRLGLHAAAEWLALRSLSLPRECGGDMEMLRYTVAIAIQRGDLNLATCIIAAASLYAATRAVALETLLDIACRPAKYGAADACLLQTSLDVHARDPKVSIIVCSRDDARYAKFIAECERAFCGSNFEVIRIADAKSMCEGYNRGTDAATGELFLYCHDDIELISVGVHRALISALAHFDVATCVGSSVVDGPTWMCQDATNSQGWMAESDSESGCYSIAIIGVPNPRSLLAAGDGCFIACRRPVAQTLRWDEVTFDSFHLYDIDFCVRARNNGFRVGVARGVIINHLSQGSFDAVWHEYAQRFLQKHNIPSGPEAVNQWISIQVGTRVEAARVAGNLINSVPDDFERQLAALQGGSFDAACCEFPPLARFQSSIAELGQ